MIGPRRLLVTCPTCGTDTEILEPVIEPGYDVDPWWEPIADILVQVTQYVSPRMSGWVLKCGDTLENPPWVLRIDSVGARPRFVKEAPEWTA